MVTGDIIGGGDPTEHAGLKHIDDYDRDITYRRAHDFMKDVISHTPLSKEEQQEYIRQIKAGEIDIHRPLYLGNGHSYSIDTAFGYINERGRYNRPVFDALLDRIMATREGKTLHKTYLMKNLGAGAHYIESHFNHPAFNINDSITLSDFPAVVLCIEHASGITLHTHRLFSEQRAVMMMHSLLKRGAIPSDRIIKQVQSEQPKFYEQHLAAYMDQWQKEWDDFQSGKLKPKDVTPQHMGHFYAIGHLSNAMRAEQWTGVESYPIALHSELPDWIQKKHPCDLEITGLFAKMAPSNVISAKASVEALKTPQKQKITH